MHQITSKTLVQVRDLMAGGELTARQAVAACLEAIDATEPKVNALLHVEREQALQTAKAMDETGYDATRPLWGRSCHHQGRPDDQGHAHHLRFPHSGKFPAAL